MIKVSDLIFDFIAAKGIDTIFTVSGGGCMHLTDSLGKHPDLKYVCNHHEQACAMAAEGYARVSDKPGCILVTTGPGGTNALTGVLGAYQDSIPMIILSGQVPINQMSKVTGCRQIGQQEFNIVDTVRTMTKYAVTILHKRDILYQLQKAYHIATTGRPGPVWLDIPLDIQNSEVDYDSLSQHIIVGIPVLDSMSFKKLQKLLMQSKRPVVVVGGGIRVSHTVGQLKQFLAQTGIPVMSGPHSAVDTVNTDYEHYAGRFGLLGQRTSNQLIQESDLVISLGSRLNPKMVGYDSMKFAPKAVKFVVDVDQCEIDKLRFTEKVGWCIDLADFFKFVNPRITVPDISEWQQRVKQVRTTEQLVMDKHKQLTGFVSTYVFAQTLEKHLTDDSIIVTSNGTAHVVPLKTISLRGNQRLFSNEGTAPMGYGLPAAIGAYYGSNKPVICIEGDGSLMMNLQELETARHLPLHLVVLNNGGYLSIKLTQSAFFNGHQVAAGKSSGVTLPSLEKIADTFGFKYYSIDDNTQIDGVLSSALSETGPTLIEVFSDPEEKHEPKVRSKGIDRAGNMIPGELTDIG